jgi:purine-binding chemotaxis protein CheW
VPGRLQPLPDSSAAPGVHVRLCVGREEYALPVGDVLTVLDAEGVTPVLGAPSSVLGLRALRGRLLPVFDLATVLGVTHGSARRVVVVPHEQTQVGLAVDDVLDVVELPEADEREDTVHLRGAVLVDGVLIGVLDIAAILRGLEAELGA